MGLTSICQKGYRLDVCRCAKEHRPLKVKPCPPGHSHQGFPMDVDGKAIDPPADKKVCDRCEELHRSDEFRGGVCGFCADQLEDIEGQEVLKAP